MKTFLSILLLSCFTVTAFATTELPKDVSALSYLTNGEIINVENVTPLLPANCGTPHGPACMPPIQTSLITILYTLPGCVDELGPVAHKILRAADGSHRLVVSAVAVQRKMSDHISCFVANTQTVKLRVHGSISNLQLVQLGQGLAPHKDLSKYDQALVQSDDVVLEKVEVLTGNPNGIHAMPATRLTLKVQRGSCVNTVMPVAHTIVRQATPGNHLPLANVVVSAPVVLSKLALTALCTPESHVQTVTIDLPGIINASRINLVNLQ